MILQNCPTNIEARIAKRNLCLPLQPTIVFPWSLTMWVQCKKRYESCLNWSFKSRIRAKNSDTRPSPRRENILFHSCRHFLDIQIAANQFEDLVDYDDRKRKDKALKSLNVSDTIEKTWCVWTETMIKSSTNHLLGGRPSLKWKWAVSNACDTPSKLWVLIYSTILVSRPRRKVGLVWSVRVQRCQTLALAQLDRCKKLTSGCWYSDQS